MKIKTWLPLFHGFYNTGMIPSDNECEVEMLAEEEGISEDEIFDRLDYHAEKLDASKQIVKSVERLLKEIIPDIKISFEKVNSPKFYNFSNDSIDVEIETETDLTSLVKDDEDFKAYIKKKYTSRDGFSSHYENDSEEWLKSYKEDEAHKAGSILNFLAEKHHGNEKCFETLYYDVAENLCLGNYLIDKS